MAQFEFYFLIENYELQIIIYDAYLNHISILVLYYINSRGESQITL